MGRGSEHDMLLINKSPRAALDRKVAEEIRIGNEVEYLGLRVFDLCTYYWKGEIEA